MKLTSTQIEQTLGQFEAEPIPEDHPDNSAAQRGVWGTHIFRQ